MSSGVVSSAMEVFGLAAMRKMTGSNWQLRNKIIAAYQLRRLRSLASHAYRHSEFYRQLFTSHGIQENDLRGIHFHDLPLINKKDVLQNVASIWTDRSLRFDDVTHFTHHQKEFGDTYQKKYKCFTTSGSLAAKMQVVYSVKEWNKLITNIFFVSSKPNFLKGEKTRVVMIGLTEGRSAGITFFRALPDSIYEKKELSLLSPVEEIVHELNKFNPDQIISYPGVFTSLLPYKRKGILNIFPKKIGLSGELLTDENERAIREEFGAQVINSYGASECLIMGMRITGPSIDNDKSRFVLFPHLAKIEILDANNKPVQEGEIGKVIITNLFNYTQPFIRYEVGDLAKPERNENGEFTFNGIIGRNHAPIYFENNNGEQTHFHHAVFYDSLLNQNGIHKTQVAIGKNSVRALLVGSSEAVQGSEACFKEFLRKMNAEKSIRFDVQQVTDIPPEKNGKIPFFKYMDG